jgi:hypothetical protein
MRTGDASIATDVNTQNFSLTADAGAIAVNSQIDASAAKGGTIELYAKNDLTLNANAKLLAKGIADKSTTAGTQGNGGNVILSSDSGKVSANSSALIDVTGDQVGTVKGLGGNVIFRGARNGRFATTGAYDNTYNGGVNVDTNVTGTVKGASKILVEALGVYDASSTQVIDSALIGTVVSDTNVFANYIAANSTGPASFAFKPANDGLLVSVTPGVEIRSSGDLTLNTNWVLGNRTTAQSMPSGGVLTLRAGGSLNILSNLDDEQFRVTSNIVNASPASWSYRLIGNADLTSVSPKTVEVAPNPLVPSVSIAGCKICKNWRWVYRCGSRW